MVCRRSLTDVLTDQGAKKCGRQAAPRIPGGVSDSQSIPVQQHPSPKTRIFALIAVSWLCLCSEYERANAQTTTASPALSSTCLRSGYSETEPSCPDAPRKVQGLSRVYGGIEYLHWWVKDAPFSAPLVSTGPPSNDEGFLVNSGTTILYGAAFAPATGGKDHQGFPGFSGGRLTLGYMLDETNNVNIETKLFGLASQRSSFATGGNSTALGSPGIRIPVFNTVPYTPGSATDLTLSENGLPVSIPGIIAGKVLITNSVSLWGLDAVSVLNIYRSAMWELNALAGFQYLDLSENFNLTDSIVGISSPFLGQSGSVSDHFRTRNQFYGAALGLRARGSWGRFAIDVTGRVGLGASHEVLNVSGAFQAVNFTASSGSQGIFAQPSNSGRRSSNNFAVVPEFEVKLGYELTQSVRLTLGYNFLYYSSVVRPGNQISHNIPKGQIFEQGGASVSSTSPAALFNKTDFFAQGLSVGLAVRF